MQHKNLSLPAGRDAYCSVAGNSGASGLFSDLRQILKAADYPEVNSL